MEKTISIIGIGRLGLCMALSFSLKGFNVVGVDLDSNYINSLNTKTFSSFEPHVNEYLSQVTTFEASTNLQKALDHSRLIFISVPTPNGGGEDFYDHSILTNLLTRINRLKPKDKHFVICCTVMPGFCDKIGKLLVEDCENCTLSYNPEFIAQGAIIFGLENPDMILIGEGSVQAGDQIQQVYKKVCLSSPTICRMKPLEAEIVKLSVNGFITTKIAYANMIGDACLGCGADPGVVMSAVGQDSRIGTKYFKPGYSYGGPCFPRDTQALSLFVTSQGLLPSILKATHESNEKHVEYQVNQLLKTQNTQFTFTGICYKEGSKVPIIDESPKLKIAKRLVESGKKVTICDTKALIDEVKKKYGNLFMYVIEQ